MLYDIPIVFEMHLSIWNHVLLYHISKLETGFVFTTCNGLRGIDQNCVYFSSLIPSKYRVT